MTAITTAMVGRPQAEVRAHVDVVRTVLYEEVLPQASVEELELLPHLDHEHDDAVLVFDQDETATG